MIILCFDVASRTGYACYDVSDTPSSIANGYVDLVGKTPFEKVRSARELIPPIVKRYKPDFVMLEAPLQFIPSFEKKQKPNLFGAENEKPQMTINAGTILMLSRISGAVQAIIEGFRIPCEEVPPKTWQTIIPKKYKGDNKSKIRQFADSLGIIGKNQDSLDASLMCIYAAGRSQVLKLERMTEGR